MKSISPRRARPSRVNRPSTSEPQTDRIYKDEAVLVLGWEGTVDHISEEARRILDLNGHPFTGTSFFHQIPLEDALRLRRMFLDLNGQPVGTITSLLQIKTGLGPWQWYKVEAESRKAFDTRRGILLRLQERGYVEGRR